MGRMQIPEDGAERGAIGEVLIGLTHDGKIGKGVERLAVSAVRGPDQPPLLHVAKLILAEVRIPLQQLTTRERGRTGCHQDVTNIIQG